MTILFILFIIIFFILVMKEEDKEHRKFLENRHKHKCENCINFKEIKK